MQTCSQDEVIGTFNKLKSTFREIFGTAVDTPKLEVTGTNDERAAKKLIQGDTP